MSELLDLPLIQVVDLPFIHVVLVEDDIAFQKAFRAAISLAPDMHLVTVASNRAQALQALEGAPADIRANSDIQDVYLGRARHHHA